MADDTRQREDLSKEALTVSPENKPFAGSQWQDAKQTKTYNTPENANLMAGGTQNTAGGQMPEVTIANAFPKFSEFSQFHKKPCVRDSLLNGIGAGFAFGGIRALFGAAVWTACSWATWSFLLGSGVMYQWCMFKRNQEREGMNRVMEIMNKKEIERKAREAHKERMREERRRMKDQELDDTLVKLKEAKDANIGGGGISKPWWKVW